MLIKPLLEAGAGAEHGNNDHFRTFLGGAGQLGRGRLSAFDPLVNKGGASGNVALQCRTIKVTFGLPQAGCASKVIAESICQARDDMTCPDPSAIQSQPAVEGKREREAPKGEPDFSALRLQHARDSGSPFSRTARICKSEFM